MKRATRAWLVAGALLSCAIPAHAQSEDAQLPSATEPLKVHVGKLQGAKPTSARDWLVEGLQASGEVELLSPEEPQLETGASQADISAYAAQVEADVVILGRCRFGNGWSAELTVHDGKDGSVVGTHEIEGGSWAEYESELKEGAFSDLFAQATGYPPPEPDPIPEAEPEEAPAEEAVSAEPDEARPRPEPLRVQGGVRIYSRSFRYTDSLAQLDVPGAEPLESYNLDAGPMPLLHVQWYPGAHFTSGVLAHLGLSAGYELGVGTQVQYLDDSGDTQTFGQNHQLVFGGLRARIPIDWLTIGVLGHAGHHTFALRSKSGDTAPEALFPNVAYTFVEAGADLEVQVGHVFLGAHGSYLAVLSAGDIAGDAWFPDASAFGVHYGANAGVAVSRAFDVIAGVDARLMAFDFNPISAEVDPTVTPVAGGASDHYLSAFLALRFRLPGEPEASADADRPASGDSGSSDDSGFDDFDSFD